jgi:ParB/RepB/Spo0J family partition protein
MDEKQAARSAASQKGMETRRAKAAAAKAEAAAQVGAALGPGGFGFTQEDAEALRELLTLEPALLQARGADSWVVQVGKVAYFLNRKDDRVAAYATRGADGSTYLGSCGQWGQARRELGVLLRQVRKLAGRKGGAVVAEEVEEFAGDPPVLDAAGAAALRTACRELAEEAAALVQVPALGPPVEVLGEPRLVQIAVPDPSPETAGAAVVDGPEFRKGEAVEWAGTFGLSPVLWQGEVIDVKPRGQQFGSEFPHYVVKVSRCLDPKGAELGGPVGRYLDVPLLEPTLRREGHGSPSKELASLSGIVARVLADSGLDPKAVRTAALRCRAEATVGDTVGAWRLAGWKGGPVAEDEGEVAARDNSGLVVNYTGADGREHQSRWGWGVPGLRLVRQRGEVAGPAPAGMVLVDLDSLVDSPFQVRQDYDEAALSTLAASIRKQGLLEPILVRPFPGPWCRPRQVGDVELPPVPITVRWELVAGHRRVRAARLAGLRQVPALNRGDGMTDDEAFEVLVTENAVRLGNTPMEEARAIVEAKRRGFTGKQIGVMFGGKSPAYVSSRARLVELPEDVQQAVQAGKITASLADELARKWAAHPAICSKLGELAARGELTVRDLEARGLPRSSALSAVGLAVNMSYGTPFDVETVCRASKCPYLVASGTWDRWCINPALYEQHAAEAVAAQAAAATEEEAQLRAELGPDVLLRASQIPGAFILHGDCPVACAAGCPYQRKALGDGGKPVVICTNREEHNARRQAEVKAREKQLADRAAHVARQAAAALRERPERVAALMVLNSLGMHSDSFLKDNLPALLEAEGLDAAAAAALTKLLTAQRNGSAMRRWVDALAAALGPETLLRLAVAVRVRYEVQSMQYGRTPEYALALCPELDLAGGAVDPGMDCGHCGKALRDGEPCPCVRGRAVHPECEVDALDVLFQEAAAKVPGVDAAGLHEFAQERAEGASYDAVLGAIAGGFIGAAEVRAWVRELEAAEAPPAAPEPAGGMVYMPAGERFAAEFRQANGIPEPGAELLSVTAESSSSEPKAPVYPPAAEYSAAHGWLPGRTVEALPGTPEPGAVYQLIELRGQMWETERVDTGERVSIVPSDWYLVVGGAQPGDWPVTPADAAAMVMAAAEPAPDAWAPGRQVLSNGGQVYHLLEPKLGSQWSARLVDAAGARLKEGDVYTIQERGLWTLLPPSAPSLSLPLDDPHPVCVANGFATQSAAETAALSPSGRKRSRK